MNRFDTLGYPIIADDDPAPHLATYARERDARVIVLCDANPHVLARATRLARAVGRKTPVLSFALGERRKHLRTVQRVLDALAEAGADRGTLVVGVGGGVAGDLFGFVASVYMRGVAFVNVATSLVAMVDASVGGKTGVDLAAGKNLAGTFRDPKMVLADIGALATLAPKEFREGLGEIVKHGIIEGGDAFSSLETLAPFPFAKWPWQAIVEDSIRIKAMVVADDRTEQGGREVLNLGHTFAHAIEHVTNYRTPHGAAVAIGLRGAGLLALRTGRFSRDEHLRVLSLLTLLRLPVVLPESAISDLLAAMGSDKKARDGTLRFVLPRTIGDVEFGVLAPPRTVRTVLARLAEPPGPREFR